MVVVVVAVVVVTVVMTVVVGTVVVTTVVVVGVGDVIWTLRSRKLHCIMVSPGVRLSIFPQVSVKVLSV